MFTPTFIKKGVSWALSEFVVPPQNLLGSQHWTNAGLQEL